MSKVKYYYDSETLSYRKIERKKGRKIEYFLSYFRDAFSGFLSVVLLNIPDSKPQKKRP